MNMTVTAMFMSPKLNSAWLDLPCKGGIARSGARVLAQGKKWLRFAEVNLLLLEGRSRSRLIYAIVVGFLIGPMEWGGG